VEQQAELAAPEEQQQFKIGMLVTVTADLAGVDVGDVVQVIGFRKRKLRLLPIGGVPVLGTAGDVAPSGLPSGSPRPPQRWNRRRPKPKKPST
jgi:hypothetical protein